MIFLSATEPNVSLSVYGTDFTLAPIEYPEVNIANILAMENPLAKRILDLNKTKIHRLVFEADRLPGFPKLLPALNEVPPGSKVLVIRGGGIGDVLMCTPVIRFLRENLPGVHLTLATFKRNDTLFKSNPHLDAVVAQPLTLGELMEADFVVEFADPDISIDDTHMTDYYLRCIGIAPETVSDKTPILSIDGLIDPATVRSVTTAAHGFKRSVYLNGLASDRLRDLSPALLSIFPRTRSDILFVVPTAYEERYGTDSPTLYDRPNILRLDTADSLSAFVTAIHCCNAVVTTDSSAYHIAAALEKPCLTLFGPIDPKLRTRYYPTVISLKARYNGHTCQSPCGKSMISEFFDDRIDGEKKCPEASTKNMDFSPCLASFSKTRLMDAFNRITNIQDHQSSIGA